MRKTHGFSAPGRHGVGLVAALTATIGLAPAWAEPGKAFDKALAGLLRHRDAKAAERAFLDEAKAPGRNQLLCLYELATFRQWAGDSARSAELFAKADQVARDYELKALASVSGGLRQAGAVLTNDKLLPWEGAAFDKVMSRTLNAMNFLALQNLEAARVEVRKAEEYQVRERARVQGQVERTGDVTMTNPVMASAYAAMASKVRGVRNSYENAFTYYLSSQVYRAQGQEGLDDALVDIKRAYALAPEAPAVRDAYLDLLAARDPLAAQEQAARLGLKNWAPANPAGGTVVVLYAAGLVPRLSEVKLDIPVPEEREDQPPTTRLVSLAFPIYRDLGKPELPLRIQTPGGIQTTARVVDLRPLAVKALEERMPAILVRTLAGAAGKVEGQKKAEEAGGLFGKFLAEVVTAAVTRADLRSWQSLPGELQAAQFAVPPGLGELTLSAGGWTEKVTLDVVPGGTTFLMVRAVPGFRTVKAVAFRP